MLCVPASIETVEKAAGALDDVDAFDDSMADKRRENGVASHEESVEIARRLSRSPTEPRGIDVVGPLFERPHRHPGAAKGKQKSQRDQSLAGAPGHASDQQAR